MELTNTQKWIVIGLTIGLLIINGYLVWKLLNDEVPKQCPVPINEISFCDCVYNALGSKSLRYCICYVGDKRINLNEVINGTSRNN